MQNTGLNETNMNLASGEQKATDLSHTKVDPYQDPAYNAHPQSPAHGEGQPTTPTPVAQTPVGQAPVGQEDSCLDQARAGVGQEDSVFVQAADSRKPNHFQAPTDYRPHHEDSLNSDTDMDDNWG